ncbi:Cupin domain-containing protein [Pontibacter ummariensis]|uniref:Cupin domain-containing protein n=1 Tax=Pontibacter ummariensis TaxID=1610492 RepID=A0A239DE60_9BACT|nr:cupin domain-containing protein [Pontibacter ummariensis]PRY14380.1 Cupin domain-containing protein [Pontibacter ummariensis]SNS30610.1 Cupin domain-containing protein [Pontibacter ummariensis]
MIKLKRIPLLLCAALTLAGIMIDARAQSQIARKDLLLADLKEERVSSVRVVEVRFPGGQKAPYHKHPCLVVGYIVEGTCLLQVEGKPTQVLKAGDAFFEPADTPIIHFDNYSQSQPLRFIANYLPDGESELIELLPEKEK